MIKYSFIPPGLQVVPENDKLIFPSAPQFGVFQKGVSFLCDVGSYLGDGIIDHHTLDKENECATTLVFAESEKLVKNIITSDSNEFTVITHFDPDFDAIGCSYFVTKIILQENISPSFSKLANYILDVDLGKIRLDENSIITPFSMILAVANIINKTFEPLISTADKDSRFELILKKNEEILMRSFKLIDFILGKLDSGIGLNDSAIFTGSSEFSAEIELLTDDYQKYTKDYNRSNKYIISLFKKETDKADEVDLIVTDSPESVLWKYWVRGDRKHTKNGFIFTCAFLDSYRSKKRNRAIIAVDRTTDYTLKGLGLALDEAEMNKIAISNNSLSADEVKLLLLLSPDKRRNRYHRGDPWFDERDEFTIIDSPREGSVLTNQEIIKIILSNDYWQYLSKKLVDDNYNFLCDTEILFPNLFQSSEPNSINRLCEDFFTTFSSGILDGSMLNNLIAEIRSHLLSTNEQHIRKGINLLKITFYKLSQIPNDHLLSTKRICEIKNKLLELSKEALIKSGGNEEGYLQDEIIELIYFYYDSLTLREIFPCFRIINPGSFYKYFLYSIRKLSYKEILSLAFLLLENNDSHFFTNIYNLLNDSISTEYNKNGLMSIFSILILLKQQTKIIFSPAHQPISAFDDWKDSIDDFLFFKGYDKKYESLISDFIKQDSSYFLNPELSVNNFDEFIINFDKIKNNIIFDDIFWKYYLDTKSAIEHRYNKDNRFNILRKFTKTYIIECSLTEFFPLINLIKSNYSSDNKNISADFVSHINLLFSIKIFDDLLFRIKLLANLNFIEHSLKQYELSDLSIGTNKALFFVYPLKFTLGKLLKLLITSQYLPDISLYRFETQEVIHEFSANVSGLSCHEYGKEQIEIFFNIKDILELVNLKNSISSGEYDQKLNILEKIIFKIDTQNGNLIDIIDIKLPEPDRSLLKEILFTLRSQLINEKTFLTKNIKENLRNETQQSRSSLKALLTNIVKEATKDELRKAKQNVDFFNDQNLKSKFYEKIIKPYRILSFSVSHYKNPESEKELLRFSKDIRKLIFTNDMLTNDKLKLIINIIDTKRYNIPVIENELFLNLIFKTQHEPTSATLLPESINIETYEFLVNHFLDKYSIDDAREKIDEYTISKYSKIFRFLTSWWIAVILILSLGSSFFLLLDDKNIYINSINCGILALITFLPSVLLLVFLARFLFNSSSKRNRRKASKSIHENISVYSHLSEYGTNRISKLSLKLLLIEFMIPLFLGILAAMQNNNLLYGLLKIGDFRLIAILPIMISLSYYSLFKNISSKNPNFSGTELNKTSLKIYIILFTQAWLITITLLNIFVRYVFINSNTFNTDWNQVITVGKVLNFWGMDFLIFPTGAITITFISLFVGLFVESFNDKTM